MNRCRDGLLAALATLGLAIPPATAPVVRAEPRPPTVPDTTAGERQFAYYVFVRHDADEPWLSMGSHPTEALANFAAERLKHYGCEVFVRKVKLAAAPATPAAFDVAGEWSSDWGPVKFSAAAGSDGAPARVTGSWQQGEKMRGQITDGTFDPRMGKLTFKYYQDWNDQQGKVEMSMSDDGQTLTGTWTQEDGSGDWVMTRKK